MTLTQQSRQGPADLVRRHIACILLIACAMGSSAGNAADPAAPAETGTASLQFRRLYVPAGRESQWPLGARQYVPVERAEFEELVGSTSVAKEPADPFAPRLVEAHYRATYRAGALLNGHAGLLISHHGEEPARLDLEPCNLALGFARWVAEPPQEAVVGCDQAGRLAVRVERSDRLELDWTRAGQRELDGSVVFALELPPCAATSLEIELPSDSRLIASHGVVVGPPDSSNDGSSDDNSSNDGGSWRVYPGSTASLELRVVPRVGPQQQQQEQPQQQQQLVLFEQTLTYDLSTRGLKLTSLIELESHQRSLDVLVVDLDPGLQLVAARMGDEPLDWSTGPTQPDGRSRYVVALPSSRPTSGGTLRLTALAPAVVDQRWSLPSIHVDGLFWQQGHVSLRVQAPLYVEALSIRDGRQSGIAPLPSPLVGEAIDVQMFRRDAAVELVARAREELIDLRAVASFQMGAAEVVGQWVLDLRAVEAGRFDLEADVIDPWTIDSVVAEPGETLRDWTLEAADGASQRLQVQLSRAVGRQQPVRLRLTGRRLQSPLDRPMNLQELAMVRFRHVRSADQLLRLQAVEPYRLDTSGLPILDAESLEPFWNDLLAAPGAGTLVRVGPEFPPATLEVSLRQPRYAVSIRVDASLDASHLREQYTVECRPESGRVDRLLVRLSRARSEDLVWSLGPDATDQLTARRLSAAEELAAGWIGGETWELRLRTPRSNDFEVRATRSVRLDGVETVSLVAIPEASTQRGLVVVHALEETPLKVDAQALVAILPEPTLDEQATTARVTYSYDPNQDADPLVGATITVSRDRDAEQPSASFVWRQRVISRFAIDGVGQHVAIYEVQNDGARELRIRLPQGVEFRGVWIDRQPAVWERHPGLLRIELPPTVRFPEVAVTFVTREAALGFRRRLPLSLPTVEGTSPRLGVEWSVWVPPSHEIGTVAAPWQRAQTPQYSAIERLFGVLARNPAEAPFDPLMAQEWNRPLQRATAPHQARRLGQHFLEIVGSSGRPNTTWREFLDVVEAQLKADGYSLLLDAPELLDAGISPALPWSHKSSESGSRRGSEWLDRFGLTAIVHGSSVLLTSRRAAAMSSWQLDPLDDVTLFRALPGPLAASIETGAQVGSIGPIRANQWQSAATAPWTAARFPQADPADTHGWRAATLTGPADQSPSIVVIERSTFEAHRWAILLVSTIISARWLSRRVRLAVLLAVVGGLAALWLPPHYAPLASSAWLGILAGLVFSAIRCSSRHTPADEASTIRSAPAMPSSIAPLILAGALLSIAIGTIGADEQSDPPTPASTSAPATSPAPADAPTSIAAPSPAATMSPASAPAAAAATTPMAAATAAGTATESGSDAATDADVYTVFIPVDDQRQPVGDSYLVPTELYFQLRRLREAQQAGPPTVYVRSAQYDAEAHWDPSHGQYQLASLTAEYDLFVEPPHTRVQIEIPPGDIDWMAGTASLDGESVSLVWDAQRGSMSFDVPAPGTHRLVIAARPSAIKRPFASGSRWRLARAAHARLQLTAPLASGSLSLPGALGPVEIDRTASQMQAALGPIGSLAWTWDAATSDAAPAVAAVEELLWLVVRPGAVVLDAHYIVSGESPARRQIELLADARLRLLPDTTSDVVVQTARLNSGDAQKLRVEYGGDSTEPRRIALRFLLTGTSGLGQVRLPRLEPLGVDVARRTLAVSVDDALEFDSVDAPPSGELTVDDVITRWELPTDRPRPAFALRLPPGDSTWSLATQPHAAQTTSNEQLRLACRLRRVDVNWHAQVTTSGGYVFQHQIEVPSELLIDRITAVAGGVERVLRWAREPATTVTVFLSAPVADAHDLELVGSIPVPDEGRLPLPRLALVGVEESARAIDVFRAGEVLVDLEGLAPPDRPAAAASDTATDVAGNATASAATGATTNAAHDAALEAAVDTESDDRLVARFESPAVPAQAVLRVEPNRCQLGGQLVTTLHRDRDGWSVEVLGRFDVEQGLLDELRFEVPPGFSGPTGVPEHFANRVEGLPGRPSVLVLRPRTAIQGACEVSFRGRFVPTGGASVRAPHVHLRTEGAVIRYLRLPTQFELDVLAWETRGLIPAVGPEGAAPRDFLASTFDTYEIVGDDFDALLRSVDHSLAEPQVHLADIQVVLLDDRHYAGLAVFDVDPGTTMSCHLLAPAGGQIEQVFISGVPALLEAESPGRWRLLLGTQNSPERVEVLYSGQIMQSPAEGQTLELVSPQLDGLPVERTLWTVYAGAQADTLAVQEGSTIDLLRRDTLRLKSVAALVELTVASGVLQTNQDAARWYRPWAARLSDLQQSIQRRLVGHSPAIVRETQDDLAAIAQEQQAVARRIDPTRSSAPPLDRAPVARQPWALWEALTDVQPPTSVVLFQGSKSSIGLARAWLSPDGTARLVAAACVLLLVSVVGLVWRSGPARAWLTRWPQVMGALAGLFWWWFLIPSEAGLVIVLLSALSALRRAWPRLGGTITSIHVASTDRT